MKLGAGLIVKPNEKVANYDQNKEVALRNTKPFKTCVLQFSVLPGKYAIIPLLMDQKNAETHYSLTVYFQCEPNKIKLHSGEPHAKVLEYAPERKAGRNPLFMAGDRSPVNPATNQFAKKVMAPYTLDSLLNGKANQTGKKGTQITKKNIQTIDLTMAANKKKFEQRNIFYEDNAKGSVSASSKLISQENQQKREQNRQEAIIGFDPNETMNDPYFIQKLPKGDQDKIKAAKEEAERQIDKVVDLSYYYLNNDAFYTVLPELEIKYFLGMKKLDLRGNSIDDGGLRELCDTLNLCHNTTLRELDLRETSVTDEGILGLIELMQVITTLCSVSVDGLKGVSQEVKAKLESALRKNTIQTEKQDKLNAMTAAAKKRDEYDAMGLNYVGKPY